MDWPEIIDNALTFVRYSPATKSRGRPIRSISYVNLPDGSYEATVFLEDSLFPDYKIKKTKLYDTLCGQGRSYRKFTAINMAISEALERWAYYDCAFGPIDDQIKAGLDILNSTDGFAAHPRRARARKAALFEAKERWDLSNWWAGNLQLRPANVSSDSTEGWTIISPLHGTTVLLCKKARYGSVFGFGSGSTEGQAYSSAQKELDRNERVVEKYYDHPVDLDHLYEKRLIYFSKDSGYKKFLYRVGQSQKLNKGVSVPELILDREIKGPWTKFTRVWRCLYEDTIASADIGEFKF